MATDVGRDPSGQALVASDGAATHLHPSGFDPSRSYSALLTMSSVLRHQNSVLRALVREAYHEGWSDCCIEEGSQYFIEPVEDGWADSDVKRAIPPASAIEAGTAETEGLGPKDESAAPQEDAQTQSDEGMQ